MNDERYNELLEAAKALVYRCCGKCFALSAMKVCPYCAAPMVTKTGPENCATAADSPPNLTE